MLPPPSRRERLKPCHVVIAIVLLVLLVTAATVLTLWLTVFRPRDPTVTVDLVGLRDIQLKDIAYGPRNLTTSIVIGVVNNNYGSFAWREFTASVKYNGDDVGVVPLADTVVPRRSNVNITASVILRLDKLGAGGDGHVAEEVLEDLGGGGLNLTCSVTVFGKIKVVRVWPEVSGSVYVECFSSVFFNRNATAENSGLFFGRTSCWTKLK